MERCRGHGRVYLGKENYMLKLNEGFTGKYKVTEQVYRGFMELFSDKNALHTDEGYAMSKGFEGRVMYGNILNGFISHFVGESLPLKNVIIHSQEIQYKRPVYLNDELSFEAVVSEVFESVNTAVIQYLFKNKDAKTVAKGKIQVGII